MTIVWICVTLWLGLNVGLVGLRLYVTRQRASHVRTPFERTVPVTVYRRTRKTFDRLQRQAR
jgi:hypothetical protein